MTITIMATASQIGHTAHEKQLAWSGGYAKTRSRRIFYMLTLYFESREQDIRNKVRTMLHRKSNVRGLMVLAAGAADCCAPPAAAAAFGLRYEWTQHNKHLTLETIDGR